MKAELLFTNFLIEHNLPLATADHAGPLFRATFPGSKMAKMLLCSNKDYILVHKNVFFDTLTHYGKSPGLMSKSPWF